MPDTYLMSAPEPLDMARPEEAELTSSRESRFRALYRSNAGAVARYAARRVPPDDVQDVLAETFLTAWRRLERVPDDAIPWLLATARWHIANRRRGRERRRALNDRLIKTIGDGSSSHTEIELLEMDQELVDAIRRLPVKEREAFMLVAWDELDPKRAALAAGCSSPTFRVRLHRARSRLRRELDSPVARPAPRQSLPNTQMEEIR